MKVIIIKSLKGGIKEGQIKDLPIPTAETLISKGFAELYSDEPKVKIKKAK